MAPPECCYCEAPLPDPYALLEDARGACPECAEARGVEFRLITFDLLPG